MIAILKQGTTPDQTQHLVDWLKQMHLDVHVSEGKEVTVLGLIGDTSRVDMELLKSLDMVESVKRVSEPFKQANRKFGCTCIRRQGSHGSGPDWRHQPGGYGTAEKSGYGRIGKAGFRAI